MLPAGFVENARRADSAYNIVSLDGGWLRRQIPVASRMPAAISERKYLGEWLAGWGPKYPRLTGSS